MFIPYDIVILLILSPFLLIIWIVVWVAVRLFRLVLFLAKWAVILSYRILRWSAARLAVGIAWLWRRYVVSRPNP